MQHKQNARELPVRSWPSEAYEHEPSYGYFVRLAERNMAHSTRVFADSLGLNGRHLDPEEILEFCSRLPVANVDALAAATPRADGKFVVINNHRFLKRRDWSISRPRVCDACLGESRHYRYWFDLVCIDRCPIHDRPLISKLGSANLAWWYPAVAATGEGQSVRGVSVARVSELANTWSAFVLGRLGVVCSPQVPIFAEAPLDAVLSICGLLGRAELLSCGSHVAKRSLIVQPNRAELVGFGFRLFAGGDEGLRAFLEEYKDRRITQRGTPRDAKAEWELGWLINSAKRLPENPASNRMRKHLRVFPRIRRKPPQNEQSSRGGTDNAYNVAVSLRMSVQKLQIVLEKIGLASGDHPTGRKRTFQPWEVDRVRATCKLLVPIRTAAKKLGIPTADFERLSNTGMFAPFISLPGISSPESPRYYLPEITDEVSKLKQLVLSNHATSGTDAHKRKPVRLKAFCKRTGLSACDTILKILSGKIVPVGWVNSAVGFGGCLLHPPEAIKPARGSRKPRKPNTSDILTFTEAGTLLRVNHPTVNRLVEMGYLKLDARHDLKRRSIDRESLNMFIEEYAPAKLYADAMGCLPSFAAPKLRAKGLALVELGTPTSDKFIRRADADSMLGTRLDPYRNEADSNSTFCSLLRVHLLRKKSYNRVESIVGEACILSDSGRRAAMRVHFDAIGQAVTLKVDCDPAKSVRRYRILKNAVDSGDANTLGMTIVIDGDRAVALREVISISAEGRSDAREQIFDEIDARMTSLRELFSRRDLSGEKRRDSTSNGIHGERSLGGVAPVGWLATQPLAVNTQDDTAIGGLRTGSPPSPPRD